METGEQTAVETARASRRVPRPVRLALLGLLAVLTAMSLVVWLSRERIADNIIADQLQTYDLPGTYEIESIGPARQVVRNVVIGDPARPDLTVERIAINLRYRWGFPVIGRVEITRPRLFGTMREDGGLTFGALDKVIYAESDRPPGLPDLDIKLVDGRARLDTPWGNVGFKAEGEGELDNGFAGTLAAIAPQLAHADCRLEQASAFGRVRVQGGKPAFNGPLRIAGAACTERGFALAKADFDLGVIGDASLDGLETRLGGKAGRIAVGEGSIATTALDANATLRNRRLVARFDARMGETSMDGFGFDGLKLAGTVRSDTGFANLQSNMTVDGRGLVLEPSVTNRIRAAQRSAEDTLAAPLLGRLANAVERQVQGASIAAELNLRSGGSGVTLVAPRASIRGRGGETLGVLTRVQMRLAGSGLPQIEGNIAMGGGDLPQVQGRMERDARGASVFRLRMAPYEAQGSRLAFSTLEIRQARSGALALDGMMEADGPLPGGEVRGLSIPVQGTVSPSGTLALWDSCTRIAFDRLVYSSLALDAKQMLLCPQRGAPILRYGPQGLMFAAGTPELDIKGELGGTRLALRTGAVGLAWPGSLVARDVIMVLGEPGSTTRFTIPELTGTLGRTLSGTFDNADFAMEAVPLDISQAGGTWSYVGGRLMLADAAFSLADRETEARFNPMVSRGATLQLADNRITAQAELREPASDRIVTGVEILHDLSRGTGHADLSIAGLVFDDRLQPVALTELARGLVALTDGTVRGTGRIDWNPQGVTSSGRFTTDDLDFAAPFGPVEGASGTIVFSDLLGLTTAPGQRLRLRKINPGIEVNDGEIRFALSGGTLLDVDGGSWPFLGGTLTMRPVALDFSREETRSYVFDVQGLDAALFIERLELGNLSASGTFDGSVSVVFDEFGNGFIQDSVLVSRPPGGNVSYVGELTYEDMGAIANFAFQTLKSLDFRQMRVGIEGPLAGEVLTAITFEGVTQGEGAKQNILTRRLARLPIRFNVNIRAPFYQLLNNMRSLYDPAFIQDPRSIPGLIPPENGGLSATEPTIQDPESEDKP